MRVAGVPFPKNFLAMAKTILKRLFRVYAHIYHQHFPEVVQLGEEAHLNTSFKHFIFFVQVRTAAMLHTRGDSTGSLTELTYKPYSFVKWHSYRED